MFQCDIGDDACLRTDDVGCVQPAAQAHLDDGDIDLFLCKIVELSVKQNITNKRNELRYMDEKLQIMHPSNILKRGFSITYHNGKAITDCNQVVEGQEVETIVLNGSFKSVVK